MQYKRYVEQYLLFENYKISGMWSDNKSILIKSINLYTCGINSFRCFLLKFLVSLALMQYLSTKNNKHLFFIFFFRYHF